MDSSRKIVPIDRASSNGVAESAKRWSEELDRQEALGISAKDGGEELVRSLHEPQLADWEREQDEAIREQEQEFAQELAGFSAYKGKAITLQVSDLIVNSDDEIAGKLEAKLKPAWNKLVRLEVLKPDGRLGRAFDLKLNKFFFQGRGWRPYDHLQRPNLGYVIGGLGVKSYDERGHKDATLRYYITHLGHSDTDKLIIKPLESMDHISPYLNHKVELASAENSMALAQNGDLQGRDISNQASSGTVIGRQESSAVLEV